VQKAASKSRQSMESKSGNPTLEPSTTSLADVHTVHDKFDKIHGTSLHSLWQDAFQLAERREGSLMANYRKLLVSLAGVICDTDTSIASSAEKILQGLITQRELNQWGFTVLGMEYKVRQQVDKFVKVIQWTDPIVKQAVSAEPHAGLAWSGVSVFLAVWRVFLFL